MLLLSWVLFLFLVYMFELAVGLKPGTEPLIQKNKKTKNQKPKKPIKKITLHISHTHTFIYMHTVIIKSVKEYNSNIKVLPGQTNSFSIRKHVSPGHFSLLSVCTNLFHFSKFKTSSLSLCKWWRQRRNSEGIIFWYSHCRKKLVMVNDASIHGFQPGTEQC